MNVLIVDDQSSARTMLRHVVEGIDDGITVTDFGDPIKALDWSLEHVPDLLLLDYRMPGMDGLEFARRFRHGVSNRDVPVVLITAVGDEPIRQAALEVGVLDFLIKPVRPLELRARCRNLHKPAARFCSCTNSGMPAMRAAIPPAPAGSDPAVWSVATPSVPACQPATPALRGW